MVVGGEGRKALVIVDVQNDFCAGGALPVRGSSSTIDTINRIEKSFLLRNLPIVFTRDWHPRNHCSFKSCGGPWPVHCVMNTPGAMFHPRLHVAAGALIVNKGTHPDRDAYSGFQETNLAIELFRLGVADVYVAGFATDYCVKNSVLDAMKDGFAAHVLTDCVRGVNLKPKDSMDALRDMVRRGAKLLTSKQLSRQLKRRVAFSSSS